MCPLHQKPSSACVCRCAVFETTVGSEQLLLIRKVRTTVHGVPIRTQPAWNNGVTRCQRSRRLAHLLVAHYGNARWKHLLCLCHYVECISPIVIGPVARRSRYLPSSLVVGHEQKRVELRFKRGLWSGSATVKWFVKEASKRHVGFRFARIVAVFTKRDARARYVCPSASTVSRKNEG